MTARNWNVQYNSKALISVITKMVALVVPPQVSILQMNPQLKPNQWLNCIDIRDSVDEGKDIMFRTERNKYIINSMEAIREEMVMADQGPVPKNPKYDTKTDPYRHIDSKVAGKTEVKILDPVMVNPCSYHSLETVLDNIVRNCNREWVVIGCDGLPYVLF